jgi:poly-gamma-glutamate synthesis protein (capsule biosynthesis protein)
LEILDEHGIDHAGTYAKEVYSRRIFVKYISGIRFAFLSYTYSTNGIPVTEGKPWLVNMLDETLIRAQIEKARRVADVVVVLPHMGNEYEEKPSARFVSLARSFCEWGADAVMASHPHVLQPPEFYTFTEEDGNERTSFIAYSMGNFTSGQRTAPRDAGGIFYLEYEKPNTQAEAELKRVSFTSTWVRFTDARGKFDIKVLPVYEALRDTEAGGRYNLRGQDLDRLRNVHRETTGKMLGAPLPIEEIKPEYALNKIYRRY